MKISKIQIQVPINSLIRTHRHALISILSVAAFEPQWQSWVVVKETVKPLSPKYLWSNPLEKKNLPTTDINHWSTLTSSFIVEKTKAQ